MKLIINLPRIRLSKNKKKGSCDLCGEKEAISWDEKFPLFLCRGCELSNNYKDEVWEKCLANDEYQEQVTNGTKN